MGLALGVWPVMGLALWVWLLILFNVIGEVFGLLGLLGLMGLAGDWVCCD